MSPCKICIMKALIVSVNISTANKARAILETSEQVGTRKKLHGPVVMQVVHFIMSFIQALPYGLSTLKL